MCVFTVRSIFSPFCHQEANKEHNNSISISLLLGTRMREWPRIVEHVVIGVGVAMASSISTVPLAYKRGNRLWSSSCGHFP